MACRHDRPTGPTSVHLAAPRLGRGSARVCCCQLRSRADAAHGVRARHLCLEPKRWACVVAHSTRQTGMGDTAAQARPLRRALGRTPRCGWLTSERPTRTQAASCADVELAEYRVRCAVRARSPGAAPQQSAPHTRLLARALRAAGGARTQLAVTHKRRAKGTTAFAQVGSLIHAVMLLAIACPLFQVRHAVLADC